MSIFTTIGNAVSNAWNTITGNQPQQLGSVLVSSQNVNQAQGGTNPVSIVYGSASNPQSIGGNNPNQSGTNVINNGGGGSSGGGGFISYGGGGGYSGGGTSGGTSNSLSNNQFSNTSPASIDFSPANTTTNTSSNFGSTAGTLALVGMGAYGLANSQTSSNSGFNGMVSSYSNNQLTKTDFFSNGFGQSNKTGSYDYLANEFSYSGVSGGNYSYDFSLGGGSSSSIAFSQNAYASITKIPQINTSSLTPLESIKAGGYQGVVGTISAPPSFSDLVHNRGFFGAVNYEIASFLKPGTFSANLGGGHTTQYTTGSNLLKLESPVMVSLSFTPLAPITYPYFVGTGISSYITPQGKLNLFQTSQALTENYKLPSGVSNVIAYGSPAVQIAGGVLGGYAKTTETLRLPETNFLGTQSNTYMSGTASNIGTRVQTNIFTQTEVPKFFGGYREFYGVGQASTIFKNVNAVQVGKTQITGAYSENLGFNGLDYVWGKAQAYSSNQLAFAKSYEGLNVFGKDVSQYNYQTTLGELQSAKIGDYGLLGKNIRSNYFTGSQVNYGENPVIVQGSSALVKGGEVGYPGTFEGAIFRTPYNPKPLSEGITSVIGGGSKSSPEFFNQLYKVNFPGEAGKIASSQTASILSKSSTIKPLSVSSLSEVSSQALIPQSSYYGTGTYERTSEYSALAPSLKTNQMQLNLNYQDSITKMQQSVYTPSSLSNNQIQLPRLQTNQLTNQIQNQIQNQVQVQNQQLKLNTQQIQTGTSFSFNPVIIPPTPPIIPPFKFLPGGSSELGLRNFRSRRNTRYTPDFGSLLFNVRGKYKPGRLSKSGLDVRKITPNFQFDTGLNFQNPFNKKRRSKKKR